MELEKGSIIDMVGGLRSVADNPPHPENLRVWSCGLALASCNSGTAFAYAGALVQAALYPQFA